MKHRNFSGNGGKEDYSEQNKSWPNNTDRTRWNKIRLNIIDKRNHQLKFKIWDANKQFETDPKVMGSNLVISILFFIDNNVTNYICYLLVIYYHCWDKNNPK